MAVTTAEGTLAHSMGIKILSASGTEVVATMPVAGNVQPYGLLHGGASCVLAETIGSLAAALHAGPGRVVVGIEISATRHRDSPGRGGHRGRHPGAPAAEADRVRDRHYRRGQAGACAPRGSPACSGTRYPDARPTAPIRCGNRE